MNNTTGKRLGFMTLHYGKPYIKYALHSIVPHVDKMVILYTNKPSQSYMTDWTCPDNREDLQNEIKEFEGKVEWIDGSWNHEIEHLEAIKPHTDGYEWLVRIDADEYWNDIDHHIKNAERTRSKDYRVEMIHFWKNFSRVCTDQSWPFRITNLREGREGMAWSEGKPMYHFSYVQPKEYILYKMQVSGHKPEFKPHWFEQKYLTNAQNDVHPVINDFWNAQDFDKNTLPEIMHQHPYFNEENVQ